MVVIGVYFCTFIGHLILLLSCPSEAAEGNDEYRRRLIWSQIFRIYRYDCKHGYSICSRQNILLQLIGTFDTNLDATVQRVCDPIVEYIEHYDCAIFLRKIESRWLNFYADSIMDQEMHQHYQIPSLESSEITNDFMMSVYDSFKLLDDLKLCMVGPFAIQIANMVSMLFMSNAKATILFYVPLEDIVPAEQYVTLLRKPGGFQMEVLQISDLFVSACCHVLHIRDVIAEVEAELLRSLSNSSVTVLLEQNLGFGLRSGAVDRALEMAKGWHLTSSWYRGNTVLQVTRNSAGYEIVSPGLAILDSISPEYPMEFRVRFGASPLMVQGQPPCGGRGKDFPIIDDDESTTLADADALTKKGLLAVVIFITFNEPHFIETAYGLRGALRSLGYRRFVLGPLSACKYRTLLNDGENILQIALGSHRSGMLTRWYVVFHSENVFEPYIHLDRYGSVILNAVAVFVYSHSHVDFMHRLGRHDGIYLIPMYSRSVYYPQIASGSHSNATLKSDFHTPNDVMLVMSDSARRERFMDHFLEEAHRHGVTVIRMMNISNFNFFDVRTREFLAVSSKVVLNIHQDDSSALESHRINNMLALGKCIVSERSVDAALDAEYERDDALIFTDDLSEIFPLVRALLLDDRRRRELEANAIRKYWKIQNDISMLERAMKEITSSLPFETE